jgi:hypothetical protein
MVIIPLRARRAYYTNFGHGSLFSSFAVTRTTLLLISTFALSLGSVVFALTRYASRSSRISFQLEDRTRPVYDPFTRPPAADAIADTTIRPINAHLKIPDACLDQWVSVGRWRGSCIRVPIEESAIDLVYIWVNGSCVFLVPCVATATHSSSSAVMCFIGNHEQICLSP